MELMLVNLRRAARQLRLERRDEPKSLVTELVYVVHDCATQMP